MISMAKLFPGLVRRATFLVLLLLAAACAGPALPVVTASARAPEKSPCEVAAELRARVPRLMKEGKLHRTGRVIEKANRLCRASARATSAVEVEVATALGQYAEARKLIAVIAAAGDALEETKAAAKAAAERVERFDKEYSFTGCHA
jgi:hypothetical protein